jgi:small subunit ribosomal protein S5
MNWVPKTALGKKVASGEVTDIDEIFDAGQRILEPQIVDVLLPDLKDNVLEIKSTQRMSASGRKQQMRALVILGNKRGYIAIGVGKAGEARDAIAEAIMDAKKHLIRVRLGCGSWECGCGQEHSLQRTVVGKNSSTEIVIKPAPKGVGIVAGEVAKTVLEMAGLRDAWTFARGRTRNVSNMVLACFDALDSLNNLKKGNALAQDDEGEKKIEGIQPQEPEATTTAE